MMTRFLLFVVLISLASSAMAAPFGNDQSLDQSESNSAFGTNLNSTGILNSHISTSHLNIC